MALWKYNKKILISAPCPDVYLLFGEEKVNETFVSTIAVDNCYSNTDFWVGMDCPENYEISRLQVDNIKIFRKNFKSYDLPANSLFVDVAKPNNGIIDMFRMKSENTCFAWFHHSLGISLHLALWIGFRRIHFVGLKPNGYENTMLRTFLYEFCKMADEFGIDCISCTQKSSMNGFIDYFPVEEALELSRKNTCITPIRFNNFTWLSTN